MNPHQAPPQGVVPQAAPSATKKPPKALFIAGGAVVLVGLVVLLRSAAGKQEGDCSAALDKAKATLPQDNEATTREALQSARKVCKSLTPPAFAEVEGELARRQTQATQAAQTAQREQQALAGFPTQSVAIAERIKGASALAIKKEWEKADVELIAARTALASYAGTSVAASSEWATLNARVQEVEKRIAPDLERIRAKQKAQEAAAQAIINTRGAEPPKQNGDDGQVYGVRDHLQKTAHDPDSIDVNTCSKPKADGLFWVTSCTYRGKNAFGALVRNSGTFYLQTSGDEFGMGRVVKTER